MARQKFPLEMEGVRFLTAEHAARYFRVDRSTIYNWLRKGRNIKGQKNNASPVTIRGVTYPSQIEAAKAFGLSPSTIRAYLRKGRADDIGLTTREVPTTVRGELFPSIKAAAAALNQPYQRVYRAVENGTLDQLERLEGNETST